MKELNVSTCFTSGNIKSHLEIWKSITSDRYITDIAKHGLKVDFETMSENDYATVMSYKDEEKDIIREEINKFL